MSRSLQDLARALGGVVCGHQVLAPGPGHSPKDRSLAVWPDPSAPDGFRIHSHSGDDWRACRDYVRQRLGIRRGENRPCPKRPPPSAKSNDQWKLEAAKKIWPECRSIAGTIAEAYLNSRAIALIDDIIAADALRFHAGMRHSSGGIWPAMVALVRRGPDGRSLGIHRTYLARDGSGKAPVEPQKMMLGPCRGGAVRLGDPGDVLMIGEGIETCLAVMASTGLPAWAALSTSGMCALDLPGDVREVVLLADGDEPGQAAALDAARRWTGEGRRVRIARPPSGLDFNDVLMGKSNGGGENAG